MFLFVRCLGVWAKNHQHFDENYREFPSKLFSKCSRHHLDARYTYWKKINFHYSSRILGKKFPQVLSKLHCRFSQPLFEEWYDLGKQILFLQLVAVFEWEFFKLRANISTSLWKLLATCAENSSDSKHFSKGCSFEN